MQKLLIVGLLASRGLGIAAQAIGNWTLWRFSRNCTDAVNPPLDQNRCTYQFFISESPAEDRSAVFTQCTLRVSSLVVPAEQIEWVAVPCLESAIGGAKRYAISNGWNSKGFITVNVMNVFTRENAYFGYEDKQLEGGREVANKTEAAYKFGTFGPPPSVGERIIGRGRRPPPAMGKRSGENETGCDPAWWTVKNLKRKSTTSNHLLLRFDIEQCVTKDVHCKVTTLGANFTRGIDVNLDEFHDKPCDGHQNMRISWGYKKDTDGAVMTIVDRELHRRAFFGWDQVNSPGGVYEDASGKAEDYTYKG